MNKYYLKIRTKIKYQVLNVLGAFSEPSNYIHILNGHRASKTVPNADDLQAYRKKMQCLKEKSEFINIEDALQMISDHKKVEKPYIAFTFDDGYEDCYTHVAPILEEMGVNAIFFINPNFVDAADGNEEYIKHFTTKITMSPGKRPMNWTQIKDLQKRGFIIGAHTLDHYMVNQDNQEELVHQIVDCKKVIEDKLGVPCDHFAWPYGRMSQVSQEAVELACSTYKYVFSQSDYHHYFSFNGKVFNRNQAEPWWPMKHILFFSSYKRKY